MLVMKFGGTSVQDAPAMQRLAAVVQPRVAERPVVVVSALAKVTDALLGLEAPARAGNVPDALTALHALAERHRAVAAALGAGDVGGWLADRPVADEVHAIPAPPGRPRTLAGDVAGLDAFLRAAAGRPWTDAERDAVAAHGELWSSRLVTAALRGIGLDAVWFDARLVIRTDDRFSRATPDPDAIRLHADQQLRPLLASGHVPVMQGFIGAAPDLRTTTLGRGGSDYTAALVGAGLDAALVEIWTDVNGIMTADPRIVPHARTLDAATYDEAAELATFGAKVLHPATATPLVDRNIPIVVRNSFQPAHPGTRITRTPAADAPGVRSISSKRGVTLVNIRTPRMLGAYGVLREIFEIFERHEVPVDVLASSEVSISVTIDDASRSEALRADLQRLGDVTMTPGHAIIAVVGHGLKGTPRTAARAFTAVGDVNVELISEGASAINMTFVVAEADVPVVVRRLHDEFFGPAA
jgi:aspartate kinase